MSVPVSNMINSAEKAVARLVEACRKTGPLYQGSPKAVAQVSRTGKWLLNAMAALRRDLDLAAVGKGEPKS